MKTRTTPTSLHKACRSVLLLLTFACVFAAPVLAQNTAAGTIISNTATATYTDGTPTTYSATSPTVTVTVARVSGLAITPDAGTVPNVVPGQTGVDYTFTVTNTSNYSTNVLFLALRQSIVVSGSATVAMAVVDANGDGQIDADNNGAVDAGDIDIKGNAANVSYGPVARNASFLVIVRLNIDPAAAAGSTVSVTLGDAPVRGAGDTTHDNVAPANNSVNEVRTVTSGAAPVNGESEARGDASTTVENDAQLRLSLNAPAGPVALGSDITYTWQLNNPGLRTATAQTLAGAPAGSNSGVFVIAPVPTNTTFKNVGVLPGGVTVLYTTSPLTNDPLANTTVWTTTAPGVLSTVTRVAYNLGATLAAGATVSNIQTVVTVKTGINASNPIFEIGDAFAKNRINATITDQSGDAVVNKGDGNANFDEPKIYPSGPPDPVSATQGYQLPTTLLASGSVLLGPSGQPAAVGPTNNNDDFTNLSTNTGINHPSGGTTDVSGQVVFTNTVQNTGNANDVFTFTAPTVPTGFTVEVSTNGGTTWTTVSGGGSTTLAVAFGGTANISVRVTVPVGTNVLAGFATIVRATSQNTPASTNDTIDRTYTGFLQLGKTSQLLDSTGAATTDAVPGGFIDYTITYSNISTAALAGNFSLTANNVVITEDGAAGTNNWATYTDYVLNSAVDAGGTITGNSAGSTLLKDTIATVAPGAFGTFKFRVKIK